MQRSLTGVLSRVNRLQERAQTSVQVAADVSKMSDEELHTEIFRLAVIAAGASKEFQTVEDFTTAALQGLRIVPGADPWLEELLRDRWQQAVLGR